MGRAKLADLDFRYYEVPQDRSALALTGEAWRGKYDGGGGMLHFHNLMEIGRCYDGHGKLTVSDIDYAYTGGMFSVIPKNIPHTTKSDEDSICTWEFLFIDTECIIKREYGNTPFALMLISRINRNFFFLRDEENLELARIIKSILDEITAEREFCCEYVQNLVVSLLIGIARMNLAPENELAVSRQSEINPIEGALRLVNERYAEHITIGDLAQACHMSETNFRRLFDRSINITPVEYINLIRIGKACDLLRNTNDSMEQVAQKTGYVSQSTFNRNFQSLTGVTPYKWKRMLSSYNDELVKLRVKTNLGWQAIGHLNG